MKIIQGNTMLWLMSAVLVSGGIALAARPPATLDALVVTCLVGVLGALGPIPSRVSPSQERGGTTGLRWLESVGLGIAAFAVARWLQASPTLPPPAMPLTVTGNVLAGVAEEAFFRRLLYAWLLRAGTGVAIGGTAAAFAAVHVPVYGVSILPIDFAAGLLFGWQRWATGSWSASAVTHVAANLLQMR